MKHDELVHLLETKYGLKNRSLSYRDEGSCEFTFDKKYFEKDIGSFAKFYKNLNNKDIWEIRSEVVRMCNPDAMVANVTIGDLKHEWIEIDGEIDITEEDKQIHEQLCVL